MTTGNCSAVVAPRRLLVSMFSMSKLTVSAATAQVFIPKTRRIICIWISSPFLMTSDLELGVPEVSLVSGLDGFGGVLTQEVIGALWEGRKLVGWEQF